MSHLYPSAAELMDRPVDTFSVGFRDLEKYNEMKFARQIADQFKTNHHEVIIDQKDAFEFLPRLVWHQWAVTRRRIRTGRT